MKCFICGKDYDAVECPRCHCPNIHVMGDRDAALAQLRPIILASRENFLSNVEVSLLIYHWKDQDGQIVPDREEYLRLGTAAELLKEERWLSNQFARIPDVETISVTISVAVSNSTHRLQISVPNLQQPELQRLGARLDDDMNLRLLLCNDSQQPVSSAPVPLLPA